MGTKVAEIKNEIRVNFGTTFMYVTSKEALYKSTMLKPLKELKPYFIKIEKHFIWWAWASSICEEADRLPCTILYIEKWIPTSNPAIFFRDFINSQRFLKNW